MFLYRRYPLLHSRLGLLILLVLIVIILLFIFGSGSDASSKGLVNTSLEDQLSLLDQASKTMDVEQTKTVDFDESLCEDYSFDDGEEKVISGHTVHVTRIATKGAKLVVDGEESTLFEGDSEILGNNFRVDLEQVFYFGPADEDNEITLRLGCGSGAENPNDKYVRDKGKLICEEIYKTCRDSFDLE